MNWEAEIDELISLWSDVQLEILTEERWAAKRRDFYGMVKSEMEKCGNDFFFPRKKMKMLVVIRTRAERDVLDRINEGGGIVRDLAKRNEVEQVLKGLSLIAKLESYLLGPLDYRIYGPKGEDGYLVEVVEI